MDDKKIDIIVFATLFCMGLSLVFLTLFMFFMAMKTFWG